MKTTNSKSIFEQSQKYLVGGVNSPVRSFKSVGGQALVMKKGMRSKFTDVDNNEFTDYCLSWGALILGHANRNVVLAAKKTAERGFSFGTSTLAELEMAEHIVKCVPSIEKVRFVNSGTEATMSAIRLARGFTGRSKIVKFDGCYHGHSDDLLAAAGSGVAMLAESSSQGIPAEHVVNTISLPYNDIETLKTVLAKEKDTIACVILEPVAGNMGVIPADIEFLKTLRALTEQYGIVLIFDEIMSGFRTSAGCVQSDFGVIPDMTCLGKIISSGFPIGAYGGKKEIMDCLAPLGSVYQAGTFAGNPVVMKAGLAGLKQLNASVYKKLNQKCAEFADDMNAYFRENNIQAHLSHYHSMMSLRFRAEPVKNYKDAQDAQGHEKYQKLFHFLLQRGIYLPPADLESFFVSTVHSKKDMQELAEWIKEYFKGNR